MHRSTMSQACSRQISRTLMLAAAGLLFAGNQLQAAPVAQSPLGAPRSAKVHAHRVSKSPAQNPAVTQAPPPPPMPHWPVNDAPNPPSVVWDASGLRINASNSSLQQILNEVSTDTGTKVIGNVPDQRVFGTYGPGEASDVLLQLLHGSGYNVLLAGDLGRGAPSQIVLSPRRGGSSNPPGGANPPQQDVQQPEQDENETVDQPESPDQPDETTVPAIPPQNQQPNQGQPGMPPNGPMRTPQEIMQEMQQRQLLQQQPMQQQMQQQQGNPTAPQQQENPE